MKLPPLVFRALFFIVVFAVVIIVSYSIISENKKLPIYKPGQLNKELVDPSVVKTETHHVGSFALTDQRGRSITEKNLEGKIYIADFFFTTCEGICLDMSKNMAHIQNEFENEDRLMLLSHSVMPEMDSVPVLMEYAERYEANNDKWLLLTGDRKHIYDLARKNYFAATGNGDGGPNDMVHTENFVLIDMEKRIRGFYDGTNDIDVAKAIEDINTLLAEYEDQ